MTAQVLLTGATGFVGRHVLKDLLRRGIQVRAVVRESQRDRLDLVAGVESVVFTRDLFAQSPDWFAQVCAGVDTIVHVAWYAEPGIYLQSPLNLDCLSGTLNLARAAVKVGVRRFVGIGTCFEYELGGGLLSTTTPLRPLTPYAGAKAATFLALSQYLPSEAVEFAWCRLFYLYGQGEDPRRLVPYLREKLAAGQPAKLTRGNQIRDFIDVAEAAHAIGSVAMGTVQGAVNICSGIPITIKQLAENIADEYGRRDLLEFGTRPDNLIDPPIVVGIA